MNLGAIGHYFDRLPGWVIATTGLGVATPLISVPVPESSLTFGHIVQGLGVVLATLATLWPAVRSMIRKSGRETVRAVSVTTAEALSREMKIVRHEMAEAQRQAGTVAPQLTHLSHRIAEMGDLNESIHASAFEIGSLGNRLTKVERDLDVLHKWRRDTDRLLAEWKQKYLGGRG